MPPTRFGPRLHLAGAAAFALGCSSDRTADSAGPAAKGADADWSPAPLVPELEVAALPEAFNAAVATNLVHPLGFVSWFETVMQALPADEGCPGPPAPSMVEEGASISEWIGTCHGDDLEVDGGWLATWVDASGSGVIDRKVDLLFSFTGQWVADEAPVYAGGTVRGVWTIQDGVFSFQFQVDGSFRDAHAPGALGSGVSGATAWAGTWSPEAGVTGTMDGPMEGAAGAFELQNVSLHACEAGGATGSIRLRDPSSGWWTLDLAEDCSGCGSASWNGEVLGEACLGDSLGTAVDVLFAGASFVP